jgi:hypothetical protein
MPEAFRNSKEAPLGCQTWVAKHLARLILNRAGSLSPISEGVLVAQVATEQGDPLSIYGVDNATYGRINVSRGSVAGGDYNRDVTVYAREGNPSDTYNNPPSTAMDAAHLVDDLASSARKLKS